MRDDWLTTAEVAEALGINPAGLRRALLRHPGLETEKRGATRLWHPRYADPAVWRTVVAAPRGMHGRACDAAEEQ